MRLGRIFGVEVNFHWSCFLLIGMFVAFSMFGTALTSLVIGLALFAIILVHEFGHILTARYFGYPIRGITLHLLGGVAISEPKLNERWWQKFLVIFNGPLMNVIIGIGLYLCISPKTFELFSMINRGPLDNGLVSAFGFFTYCLCYIYVVNWVILIFNLIPIFPLDGGQLLQTGVWGVFRILGIKNTTAKNISNVFACSIGIVLAILCAIYFFMNLNIVIGLMFLFGVFICYATLTGSLDELRGRPNRFLS